MEYTAKHFKSKPTTLSTFHFPANSKFKLYATRTWWEMASHGPQFGWAEHCPAQPSSAQASPGQASSQFATWLPWLLGLSGRTSSSFGLPVFDWSYFMASVVPLFLFSLWLWFFFLFETFPFFKEVIFLNYLKCLPCCLCVGVCPFGRPDKDCVRAVVKSLRKLYPCVKV